MVFSSSIFIFAFLPFVLAGYYLLKESYRNAFLLLVSLLFYAWGEPKYVWIMILSIAINYLFGIFIDASKKKLGKAGNRIVLSLGVVANLALLFYFKYYNFFVENVNKIPGIELMVKNVALPIGISFFTFQGMSYILDLYMNNVKVQKNPINIALYISLFPQLIAGPIVRYKDVNDQIDCRTCNIDSFAEGIRRFAIGLAKKVIIANNTGFITDQIFDLPYWQNTPGTAWVGIICYTLQIYFDFSGYSDMAIGLGKMFGFDFLENFDHPYISTNLTEFWRRWHMSLSSWFRDYLYIPLGGNRKGNVYVNLFIVFCATGIWHGAAWNFLVWGLWHGLFLIIERILKHAGYALRLPKFIKWIYTMLVVILGWVLFRAPDLNYALGYISTMFGLVENYDVGFSALYYLNPMVITVIIIGFIASTPIAKRIKSFFGTAHGIREKAGYLLTNLYIMFLLILSIIFVMTSTYNPFIYFRF